MSGPETKGGEFPETEDWCQGLEGSKGNTQKASCWATTRWSLEVLQEPEGLREKHSGGGLRREGWKIALSMMRLDQEGTGIERYPGLREG